MTKIVELLEKYGAKSVTEIFVDKPEKFLSILSDYEPTGLQTLNGYIKIEDVPNVTISFNEWVAGNPDKWNDYDYYDGLKISNPPDFHRLKLHNEKGIQLSKEIRKCVANDIEIKYYFTSVEDFRNKNVRNVEYIIIQR